MNDSSKRVFIKRLLLAGAGLGVASAHVSATHALAQPIPPVPRLRRAPTNASLIKPRALKRGDLVGFVAPSGGMDDAALETKVKNVEALGFKVKLSKNIRAVRGNTGGTITERVSDLHEMFSDPEVAAVWPARGGSGANQLLPYLDYTLIRRHAKVFVGFSDITALNIAITKLARVVTFHGPVAFQNLRDYSVTQWEAVIMHPRRETTIYLAPDAQTIDTEHRPRTLHAGIAEGRLTGGNLSVIAAIIGTPFQADIKDALLFLEDVGESPYRIDRMLTQLSQNQNLRSIRGAMLGNFRQRRTDQEDRLTLEMALGDHFANLGVPVGAGFSVGHIANQCTLPLGVRARLDTEARTLTLLEAAVSE
jgi:muramoyltetrapeptide carboxypeptidase